MARNRGRNIFTFRPFCCILNRFRRPSGPRMALAPHQIPATCVTATPRRVTTMRIPGRRRRTRAAIAVLFLLSLVVPGGTFGWQAAPAHANTPNPTSVTIAGDLQSELGCGGDWDPGCAATHLSYDAGDDVWQSTWTVPAGSWNYKAALNNGWDENYGLHEIGRASCRERGKI